MHTLQNKPRSGHSLEAGLVNSRISVRQKSELHFLAEPGQFFNGGIFICTICGDGNRLAALDGQTQTVAGAGGCAAGQLGGDGAAVGAPGLAASTAAAQLICYNQNRAIPERGRQPRADGGADEI